MNRILNAKELTSHGNSTGRRAIIEILEAGLQASDPYYNVFKLIKLVEPDMLIVGSPHFEPPGDPRSGEEIIDLSETGRIFVFGAGKGIQRTAKAIEEILGDRLTGGHVIDKQGAPLILDNIEVTFGAHPVPDEACVRGCERILEMCRDLREDDLVFTVVGNGVSSLLTLPVPQVSLADIQHITYRFQIERGGPTLDLIPIRNHLDQMKGGKFSRYIQPARAIHIVAFLRPPYRELMEGEIYQWLHTLPDVTTFADAVNSLKKWELWDETPPAIREFFCRADPAQETLKVPEFETMDARVFCILPEHLGMAPTACNKAAELGFTPHLLFNNYTMLTEASQVGKIVASMARQSEISGEPFSPPCALVSSGEFLVTVGQERGMGGRNQEYALAAALEIADTCNVVMASVDSDGTDGPGHQFVDGCRDIPVLAGAIVDASTTVRACEQDVNIFEALRRHHTSPALYTLDDGIVATPNVSMADLSVTLILNGGKD